MSASSAASSTMSRSRTTVLVLTVIAAAFGSYYIYSSSSLDSESTSPNSGLHRRNAIHRRRRRSTAEREGSGSTGLVVEEAGEVDEGADIFARPLTDGDTVVDDHAFHEDYNWHEAPPYQRTGQNIVQLLFRVSEDATRRNAYVHRGCACNGCGVVPIRGIRYRCANCSDYDLCEGCESQGLHIKTHIFYKVRVPTPSFGPRHLQPVWYSGDPDSVLRVLPKELISRLSRETGFERPELDAYWEQWTFMANTDWRDDPDEIGLAMDRRTFERCLVPSGGYNRHPTPSLIFDRMFAFYDTNKDDLIGFPEFLHGLAYRKKRDKWSKIFDGYDIDGDGFVDRKDFLRMFRSYYVLYKQMHRDMLEGMDEQQMSTTDAHRLVSSRQPLSSAFGQDGRYPPAPDPRTGEGKTALPNGDLEISDGKGVMNESGDDTGNREDIFRRSVPPSRFLWRNRRDRNNTGYWNAMLNPPVAIEQIPEIVENLITRRRSARSRRERARQRAEVLAVLNNSNPYLTLAQQDTEENEGSSSESEGETSSPREILWPPRFVNVTDEDAEAIEGPGTRVVDVVGSTSRATVIAHAVERERTQRYIYERWKRRQFYTDEEEGATPPADWKEDDDILVHSGMAGESSNFHSQSRPSFHSRSSSRVRFAEDMDDFDTRSNPSTSSRSVPERWGGMEIPDAEKDAGKEILYQVTQQAFNELLDPLFKAQEDLALEAAKTKSDRERYRPLYSSPEFEKWALEKEAEEEGKQDREEEREKVPKPSPTIVSHQPVWPDFPEVEVEDVREHRLEHLLAATGYSVSSQDMQNDRTHELEDISTSERPNPTPGAELMQNVLDNSSQDPPSTTPTELLSMIAQYDDDHSRSPRSTPPQATPSPSSASATSSTYRDPTLPQFRPNTISPGESVPAPGSAAPARSSRFQEDVTVDDPARQRLLDLFRSETCPSPLDSNRPHPTPDQAGNPEALDEVLRTGQNSIEREKTDQEMGAKTYRDEVDRAYFYDLWKLDQAERKKEVRGGWGRLNFNEFESLVKKFIKEDSGRGGNQMDYLGSWIEFCIP